MQTKKAQTTNFSLLRGGHTPEPIDMPFWGIDWRPRRNHHCQIYVNRLRGFSAAALRKCHFLDFFERLLQHFYRADCDRTIFRGLYQIRRVPFAR